MSSRIHSRMRRSSACRCAEYRRCGKNDHFEPGGGKKFFFEKFCPVHFFCVLSTVLNNYSRLIKSSVAFYKQNSILIFKKSQNGRNSPKSKILNFSTHVTSNRDFRVGGDYLGSDKCFDQVWFNSTNGFHIWKSKSPP